MNSELAAALQDEGFPLEFIEPLERVLRRFVVLNIRDLRQEANYSIGALADKVGIDVVRLSNIERGFEAPTLGELSVILAAIEVHR